MHLKSDLDTGSAEFKENYSYNFSLAQNLRTKLTAVVAPETDTHIERHKSRGKLLARERVNYLVDYGSPFLEIGALAGLDVYPGVRAGAGIITGVGRISGRLCMILANDATVKGGTYFPLTVKKHLRAQEIALENNLPCIYLVDSGGAYLPMQDEVFPDKDHFGRIFFNQANLSARGIAQIAVVMGSCTAGGAYVPAMSDETIMVKEQATVFLGGPPLVKAATGEEVTAEELGGADVHCRKSGVADHYAEDDYDALNIAKRIVSNLGFTPDSKAVFDVIEPRDPLYDPTEIYGLLPTDSRKYFPIREILARLLDESRLDEFKKSYATSIICGFGRVRGVLTGIIANDGILFSESALKGAHFIQLCGKRGIPLLFIQNISGFMVGKNYEHGGIAKDGAKLVTAVSCVKVPKFTLIVGGSFGAGNYGMAGRAYSPRMLFTWPNSRISVMGPEQAASVLSEVRAASYSAGKKKWSTQDADRYREEIRQQYEGQASAYYATARLWDDGIIDPCSTRDTLRIALSTSFGSTPQKTDYGIFRM
jgi:3-methylcrotonyl-CoA carboxylase beta subunit